MPQPSILPLTQFPLYTYPPAQQQVPSPLRFPALNMPQYLFPSLQVSTPDPCCISSSQWPSYFAPVLECTNTPYPFALSSFHYPSQQSPFMCVNRPCPSALLLCQFPWQVAPSGHCCFPKPCLTEPTHSPSYSMPFLNLINGFETGYVLFSSASCFPLTFQPSGMSLLGSALLSFSLLANQSLRISLSDS